MASINCLIDYIGIRECSTSTPRSGVFINSYPGIDTELLDELANSEQVNFSGVWADVQLRASKVFKKDFNAVFNKRYNLKQIQRSIDIGREIDTASTTAPAAEYRGFTIELNNKNTSFVDSNMQQIYLQDVRLFLSAPESITIKVFDLDTLEEIDSKTAIGVTGFNVVNMDGNYDARRIFVAYDSTSITSVSLDIERFPQRGFNSDNCCFDFGCNSYLRLKGAKSTIADPFTVTEGNDTFGLSGVFSLVCTWEKLICNNLELVENAWINLLVSTLMEELMYSRQVNEATVFDRNRSQQLRLEYLAMYKGGTVVVEDNEMTFEGELPLLVDSIRVNDNDSCIECNDPIRFMTGTP